MANEEWHLFSLGLHILTAFEATQVALYGYSFTLRLLKADRRHPWLPALIGMSIQGAVVSTWYTLLIVTDMINRLNSWFLADAVAVGLVISNRLKIITIWRIDYGLTMWARIRCFIAEIVGVSTLTLLLHYLAGF